MRILSLLYRFRNIFILFLVLLAGLALFYPYHDFQLHLAQGDHGRDLYAFKKTMDGAVPYRDYWWVYGPLMPYYYALCYKLFGVNIHSIILGYRFLDFLSGLTAYLTLLTVIPAWMSAIGALWFWVFVSPFEYTYNHAGGLLAILVVIYFIFRYLQNQNIRYAYAGLFSAFLLGFIKINFGFSMLASLLVAIWWIDRANRNSFSLKKKYFFGAAAIAAPLLTLGIYYLFIRGLPDYVVRQCFPYFSEDRPFHPSFFGILTSAMQNTLFKLSAHWGHWIMGVFLIISAGYLVFLFWRGSLKKENKNLFLGLGILMLVCVANLHEFFLSGVYYRTYWEKPSQILLILMAVAYATLRLPKSFRLLIWLAILASALHAHYIRSSFVGYLKEPARYISLPQGKVFVGNTPVWINTVTQATDFLRNNLKENETFLALVDDPLYYFFTGKDSPTRQLAFCNHLNIHREQEKEIIVKMEEDKINYVLLSNRSFTLDDYMGIFGKTYCPLLALYIKSNFTVVAGFGDWYGGASWLANHAVKILKRIPR